MAAPSSSAPLLLILIIITLVSILISTTESQDSLNCANVESDIASCLPYLTGTGSLSTSCCTAISQLYGQISGNSAALQSACQCLKTLTNNVPGFDYGTAASLPQQCGVNLPFTISPNIDCNNL